MNKSTLLALLMVAGSGWLFSGCVVSDGYYGDPYYSGSDVVIAPALPYEVYLYDRPYYSYGGFYYFYDNDRWYYSRSKGGRWLDLPRSHWPHDTRWRGRHYYNDHRNFKEERRPVRDPRRDEQFRYNKDPRWNNNNYHPNAAPRQDNKYRRDEPRYKDPRRDDQRRPEMDSRRHDRRPPQAEPRRDEKGRPDFDQQHQKPVNRSMDQRSNNDRNRKDQFRHDRNQDRNGKKWKEDEPQKPWRQ